MPRLADLQEARAAGVSAMRELTDLADKESRDLSADEDKRFKEHKAEVVGLDRKIERARDLAEAERSAPAILHSGRGDGNFEERARSFSVVKAIASAMGDPNVDAGFEREISTEVERRTGRKARGNFIIPDQYFVERRVLGDSVMLTSGEGSDLYPTTLRGDLFVDRLRDAVVVAKAGATILDGLVGTIDIPRQTGSATAAWVAEDAALTDTTLTFDQIVMAPKTVGAITAYSRRMLINSVPSIENIVRQDLSAIVANAIDAQALMGSGASNTPTGVVFETGTNEISGDGLIRWAKVLEFISAIQTSNADVGSMAWIMNASTVAALRNILKSSADTSSNFLMSDPNSLAGFPVFVTNAISNDVQSDSPATEPYIFFGAWSQLLVGYWSGVDILINPYEGVAYSKARVLVRVLRDCDIAVRQPKAFSWSENMVTVE